MAGNQVSIGSPENPQGQFSTEIQKVTGITLNQSDQTIEVDETVNVIATISPDDAYNKQVNWISSDPNVATLSSTTTNSGEAITVTATNGGTTTITAIAADGSGKKASFELTVIKIILTDIPLDKTYAEFAIGGTITITAITTPNNAKANSFTWSISNDEVATISPNGKQITVTGIRQGSITITATSKDDESISASCTVAVDVLTFDYTGGIVTVPLSAGTYFMETYGAQGGNSGGLRRVCSLRIPT